MWKEIYNDRYRMTVAKRAVEKASYRQVQKVSITEMWKELHNESNSMSEPQVFKERAT